MACAKGMEDREQDKTNAMQYLIIKRESQIKPKETTKKTAFFLKRKKIKCAKRNKCHLAAEEVMAETFNVLWNQKQPTQGIQMYTYNHKRFGWLIVVPSRFYTAILQT